MQIIANRIQEEPETSSFSYRADCWGLVDRQRALGPIQSELPIFDPVSHPTHNAPKVGGRTFLIRHTIKYNPNNQPQALISIITHFNIRMLQYKQTFQSLLELNLKKKPINKNYKVSNFLPNQELGIHDFASRECHVCDSLDISVEVSRTLPDTARECQNPERHPPIALSKDLTQ